MVIQAITESISKITHNSYVIICVYAEQFFKCSLLSLLYVYWLRRPVSFWWFHIQGKESKWVCWKGRIIIHPQRKEFDRVKHLWDCSWECSYINPVFLLGVNLLFGSSNGRRETCSYSRRIANIVSFLINFLINQTSILYPSKLCLLGWNGLPRLSVNIVVMSETWDPRHRGFFQ